MFPKANYYKKKRAERKKKLLEGLTKQILSLKKIEAYSTYSKYNIELKLTEGI